MKSNFYEVDLALIILPNTLSWSSLIGHICFFPKSAPWNQQEYSNVSMTGFGQIRAEKAGDLYKRYGSNLGIAQNGKYYLPTPTTCKCNFRLCKIYLFLIIVGSVPNKDDCYHRVWGEWPNNDAPIGWNTIRKRGFCVRGFSVRGVSLSNQVSMCTKKMQHCANKIKCSSRFRVSALCKLFYQHYTLSPKSKSREL